jgi:hypothetical protein
MEYEEFHITKNVADSKRLVNLLRAAGVRLEERTLETNGGEQLIAIHPDDLETAKDLFWKDHGPGMTATSSNGRSGTDKAQMIQGSVANSFAKYGASGT